MANKIPQQELKDFQRLKAEAAGILRKITEFESQRDEHAYDSNFEIQENVAN